MSIRTLTQEDPIGLAGGLNLYGFAGGDPINFSDPFGLCKDANGHTLPNSQRRQITASEGEVIYNAASASGDWTYTRNISEKDVGNNIGDCTDYVEAAMQGAGLPSLGTASNFGAVRVGAWKEDAIGDFAGNAAFANGDFDVIDAANVRKGDIVMDGVHAGIASGQVDSNGRIQGIQNGQTNGTGLTWFSGATVYRRKVPNGNQ